MTKLLFEPTCHESFGTLGIRERSARFFSHRTIASLNCSFGSNAARKHKVNHRWARKWLFNAFLRASRNPCRTSGQSSYRKANSARDFTCGSNDTKLNDFGVNIDSYTATLSILVVQSFRTISPAERRSLARVEPLLLESSKEI